MKISLLAAAIVFTNFISISAHSKEDVTLLICRVSTPLSLFNEKNENIDIVVADDAEFVVGFSDTVDYARVFEGMSNFRGRKRDGVSKFSRSWIHPNEVIISYEYDNKEYHERYGSDQKGIIEITINRLDASFEIMTLYSVGTIESIGHFYGSCKKTYRKF